MLPDEVVGDVREEAPVHQSAHDGEGGLERRRERGEDVVTIDGEAGPRIEPIAFDEIGEHRRGLPEQCLFEEILDLTQRRQVHAFVERPRGCYQPFEPRRATRRAPGGPCPTR
jgi:hypothetical protein